MPYNIDHFVMERRDVKMKRKRQSSITMADPTMFPVLHKFDGKPNIAGFSQNVIFYLHAATSDQENISDERAIGRFEVGMAVDECDHLMNNNYEPHHVQVLSNSLRRLTNISKRMHKKSPETASRIRMALMDDEEKRIGSVDIRISVVILVQTDETQNNDVLLARTLLQGVDRSNEGIIIIGHISLLLEQKHEIWAALLNTIYRMGFMSPFLGLKCNAHEIICEGVTKPGDISIAAPKGGCLETCTQRVCGHSCDSVCHPSYEAHSTEAYWCKKLCERKCINGHACLELCYEKCRCKKKCSFLRECGHDLDSNTVCLVTCGKTLPCGHICRNKCYQCPPRHKGVVCTRPCNRRCPRGFHKCLTNHYCNTECSPCPESYTFSLQCGHQLKLECSDPDFDEGNYTCKKKCLRRYPLCNHECTHFCGEECGVCEQINERRHPKCGHSVFVPCHVPVRFNCEQRVLSEMLSRCGHAVEVPCYMAHKASAEMVASYCKRKCDTLLTLGKNDCGHYCYGSCRECYQGRFHRRCKLSCGKMLICGHKCKVNCPLICPPCTERCVKSCEHYRCPFECGLPCNYKCKKPCSYACPHSKCTKICGEVCDREGCTEACTEVLPCGHQCVGFCGEPCPKLCRFCNTEELLQGMFGGETELEPQHRFIFLPHCEHTIEESALNAWINTSTDDGEIRQKGCPLCAKPFVQLRRYSSLLAANQTEVDEVKKAIFGKVDEFTDVVNKIHMGLTERINMKEKPIVLQRFVHIMMQRLADPFLITEFSGGFFHSMYKDKAAFMEWVFAIWMNAEEEIELASHLWQKQHLNSYITMYGNVFALIGDREWPLHPNEVSSVAREINRIRDAHMLYSRMSLEIDDQILKLSASREGMRRFSAAESLVKTWGPYTTELKNRFHEALEHFTSMQSYTLDLSERERREIVQAFGGRTGRWFKCSKGHVYVVTECGGVTEIGRCNECGETIGGENHRVVTGNQLAPEMDGAEAPLYPTALLPPPE